MKYLLFSCFREKKLLIVSPFFLFFFNLLKFQNIFFLQNFALNPFDFFSWGHVKNIIYSNKPRSLEELHAKIIDVIEAITENQLQNVFQELQNGMTICMRNVGGHVEN